MFYKPYSDPSDLMDLDDGTFKGLVFSPPRKVAKPTYEIVSPVERFDQRDLVYGRHVLRSGTPEYEDYYSRHPDRKTADDERRERAARSGKARVDRDPVNEQLVLSGFYGTLALSRPDVVNAHIRMPLQPTGAVNLDRLEVDPLKMSRKLKAMGLHFGAAKVGIAELNQSWVYTHYSRPNYGKPVDLDYKYAVCLAFPRNPFMMNSWIGLGMNLETPWKYAYASLISTMMANFIKNLGWPAKALPIFDAPVMAPPLFVDAGIGEYGRCGMAIAKEFGNVFTPGGVATDMPLAPDKPVDFGLQDFCQRCKICAEKCPSGAIPSGDKVVVRGVRKWKIDGEKCFDYWIKLGTNCGICQVVCPWNHSNTLFHKGSREIAERFPFLRDTLIQGERLFYPHRKRGPDPRWLQEKV